jgi:hypothetical protein
VGDSIELIGRDQQDISVADIGCLLPLIGTILKRCAGQLRWRRYLKIGKAIFDTTLKSNQVSDRGLRGYHG